MPVTACGACFLIGPPLPLLDAEHPLFGAVMVAVANMHVKLEDLLVQMLTGELQVGEKCHAEVIRSIWPRTANRVVTQMLRDTSA
jgi:MinD superfamily P-loop ATPase